MSQPIDFYFDFSSPYGYLASEKIDDLAARYGRKVTMAADPARCRLPADRWRTADQHSAEGGVLAA
jgi:hypothetical protein